MTGVEYSPFIIKPIDGLKYSNIEFYKRYYLIHLTRSSWDHYNYVSEGEVGRETPLMRWRLHTRGESIKIYWPRRGDPEHLQNGLHMQIIFLKYRTIFKCIVRLMVLKKRAQNRIKLRKNLNIANLFRGIGNSNLNTCILNFV